MENKIREWKKEQRTAVFRLAIDGNEIMKLLEIKASPLVGKVKSELERLVLDGEIPNRKRDLKKYLVSEKKRFVLPAQKSEER